MIYILEFSQPLGSARHQAKYYIGSCRDDLLEDRLNLHRTGQGACITRAAVERGFRLELVATLPGGRKEERKLKQQKNTPRIVRKLKGKNP